MIRKAILSQARQIFLKRATTLEQWINIHWGRIDCDSNHPQQNTLEKKKTKQQKNQEKKKKYRNLIWLLPAADCQHTSCASLSYIRDEIHFQAY